MDLRNLQNCLCLLFEIRSADNFSRKQICRSHIKCQRKVSLHLADLLQTASLYHKGVHICFSHWNALEIGKTMKYNNDSGWSGFSSTDKYSTYRFSLLRLRSCSLSLLLSKRARLFLGMLERSVCTKIN